MAQFLYILFSVAMCLTRLVNLVVGHSVKFLENPDVYDVSERPGYHSHPSKPCVVEVDLQLTSVGPINNRDMDLSTTFYLRQQWQDDRLVYNATGDHLVIDKSYRYLDKIWHPDLFFPNDKQSHLNDVTHPNLFLRFYPNGTVLYSQRITSIMKCKLDLTVFPHDHQECQIPMESFGYTTKDLVFKWSSHRPAAKAEQSALFPDFQLVELTTRECIQNNYQTGNFTRLVVVVTLEREIGYYLTATYVPSILTVILSWVAFWIDHEAVPARISMGLLTVLTITTQSSGARSDLPRVSYVKAIDVWMFANLVFVFVAFIEYAVVTVMARRSKSDVYSYTIQVDEKIVENDVNNSEDLDIFESESHTDKKESLQYIVSTVHHSLDRELKVGKSAEVKLNYSRNNDRSEDRNMGRLVDFHARYLFPSAYVLFNLFYWYFYLVYKKNT